MPIPVRVYLVDDEPQVTKGLRYLLESVGTETEVYHHGADFLAAVQMAEGAACAVLDLRMPEISGIDILQKLADMRPELPVLFLSAHGDVTSAVRAMKLGAVDFLQKPFDPQTFLDCITKASRLARERYAAAATQRNRGELLSRLSARERELFQHMLQGASSKQIARLLNISPRTVDVHRASVIQKLGARTLRELVARFREPPKDQDQ